MLQVTKKTQHFFTQKGEQLTYLLQKASFTNTKLTDFIYKININTVNKKTE